MIFSLNPRWHGEYFYLFLIGFCQLNFYDMKADINWVIYFDNQSMPIASYKGEHFSLFQKSCQRGLRLYDFTMISFDQNDSLFSHLDLFAMIWKVNPTVKIVSKSSKKIYALCPFLQSLKT